MITNCIRLEHFSSRLNAGRRLRWAFSPMKTPLHSLSGISIMRKNALRATHLAAACALSAAVALPAQTPAARTVPLTPGACAVISPGDFVTFEWNPSFDRAAAVTGIENFKLSFKGPDDDAERRDGRPAFTLSLKPVRRVSPPLQSTVKATPNGYYQFQFEAFLPYVRPGTYRLATAEAVAATDGTGPAPQMTNSPLRYPFCVEVVGQTRNGRRPPQLGPAGAP